MIDVQWSVWAVLQSGCIGLLFVAYSVQLWQERKRRIHAEELRGGLWTCAGLLVLFVAHLPVFTLSATRWITIPGLVLMLAGWWRARRPSAAGMAPGLDT